MYCEFCQKAANDDAVFANFKRNPIYRDVLEHISKKLGNDYLQFIINNYPDFLMEFDKFRENDRIGNPFCYRYGDFGFFSPTTLRYIKIAGDLRARFGDLSQMHILEIGGGYGGQCKIISDMGGFASYTIVDLSAVTSLSEKYLNQFGIENVFFVDNNNLGELKTSYDLLVSNYGFLEFDRKEQEKYYETIGSANSGYITGYFSSDLDNFVSEWEFFEMATRYGIKMFEEGENPLSAATNCLITWKKR